MTTIKYRPVRMRDDDQVKTLKVGFRVQGLGMRDDDQVQTLRTTWGVLWLGLAMFS